MYDNTPEPINVDAMLASAAAVKAGLAEMQAEHAKLVGFARDVIGGVADADEYAADIQGWATKHGLMVERPATETDVRAGVDADVGDTTYVWSEWMREAIAKVER